MWTWWPRQNGGYFVQGGKGHDKDAAGPPGSATIGRVLADQLVKTGVTKPETIEFVGDDESAVHRRGYPGRRRREWRRGPEDDGAGQGMGRAGPANAMTPATTRLATASTTSIATYSTTTCGHSPARSPTSRHPRPNWADSTGECSSGLRGRPTGLEP